jgi:PAS domain S-box-containing protein
MGEETMGVEAIEQERSRPGPEVLGSPFPYRMYFDEMPAYCSVQDKQLRIIDCNRMFRKDFGDAIGRYCYEMYKKRDEKCPDCPVEKSFADGQSHTAEERLCALNGNEIPVIVYTRPIRDANGNIVAVMEMSTDISEVKSLEVQLDQSHELYRRLFESTPGYITVQDQELNIVQANDMFVEDFGEYKDCKCWQMYKHRTEPCLECPVAMTFADGKSHQGEEVVTSKTGEVYNVVLHTTPIFDASGNITQVLEMSTNITHIREMQSQLTSLGLLVGSVSHGIKGVLTSLDGGLYFLESGIKRNDPERLEKGWSTLTRNIERIRSMILDMLYYAKERDPVYEQVSPLKIASDVLTLVKHRAKKLDVEISDKFEETIEIEADAKSIHSMLVNILENALDACRLDSRKDEHKVTFALAPDDDGVVFTISDNGIGMEQETREKIFTLFFSSKGLEGTGLGLFIASKIAIQHGGSIEVDSAPGEGTTFNVRLPIKRPIVAEVNASSASVIA